MSKKTLFTFVVAGTLLGAGMAHAAGASAACASAPGAAGAAISAQLSSIAKLSGDARRSALDAFVLDLANTKYSSPAASSCAAAAISQAAQLYNSVEDQQRVQQIASSLGNQDIQTAAIDDPGATGGFDGPRGSNN